LVEDVALHQPVDGLFGGERYGSYACGHFTRAL
jgi:hypothetical protein